MRRILAFALLAAASLATAGPTWAQPFVMSDDQADRVTAGASPRPGLLEPNGFKAAPDRLAGMFGRASEPNTATNQGRHHTFTETSAAAALTVKPATVMSVIARPVPGNKM